MAKSAPVLVFVRIPDVAPLDFTGTPIVAPTTSVSSTAADIALCRHVCADHGYCNQANQEMGETLAQQQAAQEQDLRPAAKATASSQQRQMATYGHVAIFAGRMAAVTRQALKARGGHSEINTMEMEVSTAALGAKQTEQQLLRDNRLVPFSRHDTCHRVTIIPQLGALCLVGHVVALIHNVFYSGGERAHCRGRNSVVDFEASLAPLSKMVSGRNIPYPKCSFIVFAFGTWNRCGCRLHPLSGSCSALRLQKKYNYDSLWHSGNLL